MCIRDSIPASQLAKHYVEKIEDFVGKEMKLKIIEVDKAKKRIVCSRKAVLLAEEAEKKKAVWATLKEGEVVEGIVRRLTSFGVFVDIGGVDGLVHITDLSWGRVKQPSDVVSVNPVSYTHLPLFCIGLDRNDFQQLPHFELGWCGQNALFARMMLESFALDGDDSALALGLAVLDHWVRDARLENGLIKVHFEKPDGALDVCNLGFGAAELLRAHALLTGLGIERPDYRSVGLGICDFLSGHFDSRNGFGKSYGKNGRALETGGTIGALRFWAFWRPIAKPGRRAIWKWRSAGLRFM